MKRLVFVASLAATLGLSSTPTYALNFSFTGNLTSDDQVQLFSFLVGATSTVTLRSYSYAGGTNAAGQVIPRGGFDPILALFNSTGALITQQDDAGCSLVPADALTGRCWDVFLSTTLAAGSYSVSVMEYNNFANGPNISNGFTRQGQGNFTADPAFTSCPTNAPFEDVSGVNPGCQRDSHWAFDILNVAGATQEPGPGPQPTPIPEPGTLTLVGLGVVGLARLRQRLNRPHS